METSRQSLVRMFDKCLNAKYTHLENDADYATELTDKGVLYLMFQWTHSQLDWFSNLDFFPKTATPYKGMPVSWKCHRGFLRVWDTIKNKLESDKILSNPDIKQVVCIGYSHGAAIAAFAHEWVWFNRPDLRDGVKIVSFAFGAPRIFFGRMKPELKERWKNFFPIRSNNDIVTHVPPRLFGFRHVNKVTTFKNGGELIRHDEEEKWPKCVVAHTYSNYTMNILNGVANGPLSEVNIYGGECEDYDI